MTDPNIAYKLGWHKLKAELGRNPGIHDAGWLALGEEYKRAYSAIKAEETATPPGALSPRPTEPTRQAWADRPLSGPSVNGNDSGAESSPERVIAAPRPSYDPPPFTFSPSRGPNGGVMASCVVCGHLWERPKTRGRPAYKCEECR